MILPDNGKVVIIDDKIDEVIELISGLSAEKIPFVYYKDELGADLPSTPLNNVRLLFLDLLLIDDNKPTVKTVISTLVSRLKKIIPHDNGPYILIYFSSTRRIYGKAFERELSKKSLSNYKPFLCLSITKPTNLEKVKKELEKKFDDFKSLKAFLLLESVTNKAASKVVNQFTGIFTVDGTWDKNLKDVLYKTGEARVGQETFKGLDNNGKIKSALLTISSTIDESIEGEMNELDFTGINFDPLVKYDTTSDAKAKFNSRLHLFSSDNLLIRSGAIYLLRNKKAMRNEIISKLRDPKNETVISAKLFFIDLTPVCDYSQDKKYVRGVYGLLWSGNDEKVLKKSKPAFSKSSPLLFINNQGQYLILDFRFCQSMLFDEFKKLNWKPAYKVSGELLNEFQSEFSKHISRPGYTSIY